MEEIQRITSKGIDYAIDVLDQAGFLADEPTESYTENLVYLDRACERYIIASNIKGDARTDEDTMNAVLMVIFQAYLKACLNGAATNESDV